MLNDISKWIKTTTDAAIAFLGLAIIVQILFGNSVPFVEGSVINSISSILSTLGSQGLVGLVVIGVIYAIFNRPMHQK